MSSVDKSQNSTWSLNQIKSTNTVAQLLDTGNFVLRREDDADPQNYLWQSFDYPTDTLLPGMKLGRDKITNLTRYMTSWKRDDDPSSGDYSFKLDVDGFPEAFLWNREEREYRSGPWNGLRFSGVPEMKPTTILTFSFVMDSSEITYSFGLKNKSLYSRLLVNPSGVLQRYTWLDTRQDWNIFWYAPKDQCDSYKECGVFGVCDTNSSPVCKCMKGFAPKNAQEWYLRDGSDGCVRTTKLNCVDDGFLALKNMKLPESATVALDGGMSIEECGEACRKNCSCTAYGSMDIRGQGVGVRDVGRRSCRSASVRGGGGRPGSVCQGGCC
ncbi:receptor kinase 3 [Actinidia rufa]|uniref:Receptor kinase 3 n=1 Tax=Actinidia rufa TaxID=165716 RepID=A0A7J0EZX5_9ERIC|nr:receptor kinase 3 [Actinidia rufa]